MTGHSDWKDVGVPIDPVTMIVMGNSRSTNTGGMVPIPEMTLNLEIGVYRIELTPHYNVGATTTGSGWNLQGGTAVIADYSFRSRLPSTATAEYVNNYASRSQNFATAQTSRVNNNRGSIVAEFRVTSPGTLIPHFRSEVAGGSVTLLPGSVIRAEKLL